MSDFPEKDSDAAIREKVFDAAFESIDSNTVPICFIRNGEAIQNRTGVLLQIGGLRFLITTAHVDEHHTIPDAVNAGYVPSVVMPEKGVVPIPIDSERYMTTESPDEDITVYLLSDTMAEKIVGHYQFLRLSQLISKNDAAHENALYLISGFPESMVAQEAGTKRVEIWYYITRRYDGDYSDVCPFDPTTHMVVKYQRRTYNREGTTIHPPGMSGCGIWFVANRVTWPTVSANDFKLAGIQTAWHPKHEYAKGTWIDLVLKIIWRYYPDARPAMRLHNMVFDTDWPVILRAP